MSIAQEENMMAENQDAAQGAQVQEAVALPPKSRDLLEKFVRERDRLNGQIEAIVAGVRSALDVPESWVLSSLEAGFTPPAPPVQAAPPAAPLAD